MDKGIEYRKETFGLKSIEEPWGFILYCDGMEPNSIYIDSFYVDKESRGTGRAQFLFNHLKTVAKEEGKRVIIANVYLGINNPVASIMAQLKEGFVPYKADNDNIWFRMQLDTQQGET